MTDTVELIYDRTCPHADVARDRLRAALAHAGLPAVWQEWERSARGTPAYAQEWASPTILVNGRDVAAPDAEPAALDGSAGCRVYPDTAGRLEAAPAVDVIVAALSGRRRRQSGV
jgi:mercuric ion transport protein